MYADYLREIDEALQAIASADPVSVGEASDSYWSVLKKSFKRGYSSGKALGDKINRWSAGKEAPEVAPDDSRSRPAQRRSPAGSDDAAPSDSDAEFSTDIWSSQLAQHLSSMLDVPYALAKRHMDKLMAHSRVAKRAAAAARRS